MAKKNGGEALRVLVALRGSLERARENLSDAMQFAYDREAAGVARLGDDLDRVEREVENFLGVLERHWPTVDPSGRCRGCERCSAKKEGYTMDQWGKLWDIATDTVGGGPARIELDQEDCGSVLLVYPDGSRHGLVWDNGDWRFLESLNGAPGDVAARDTL